MSSSRFDERLNIAETLPVIIFVSKNIPLDANDSTVLSSADFFKIIFPSPAVRDPAHSSVIPVFTAICIALSEGTVVAKSTAYACFELIEIIKKKQIHKNIFFSLI